MKIKIILPEVEFQKVKLFLREIDIGLVKKYNISKNELHSESCRKDETHYYKSASNYFINASEDNHPFFIAELIIDFEVQSS